MKVLFLLIGLFFYSNISAFAELKCTGWVSGVAASKQLEIPLRLEYDNQYQASISGNTDQLYVLLLLDKEERKAALTLSDHKTKITSGSTSSWSSNQEFSMGYSVLGSEIMPERHVKINCRL